VGETVEGREPVFQIYTPACDVKLRMTRSFGDFYLKQNKDLIYEAQAVVAVPEVFVHTRSARYVTTLRSCALCGRLNTTCFVRKWQLYLYGTAVVK
jgi:hypothetical protein